MYIYSLGSGAYNCLYAEANTVPTGIEINRGGGQSLVTQLIDAVTQRIDQGMWKQGARLPSVRRLAESCGVSTLTVTNAYNRLVAQGIIEARRASGYFVAARAARLVPGEAFSLADAPVDASWLLQYVFEEAQAVAKVGCGWLPESWLDADGIKHGLTALSRKPGPTLVRYGNPYGYRPLRRHLQDVLAGRGIEAAPDQILLTHGATQALSLACQYLLHPGDVVLVDEPTYANLLPLLRLIGVRVIGVPRMPSGPDPALLETLAARHRPRAFFTNSTLHNPTGTSCNPHVAHRILRIADQHDFYIVEDDIFADLQQTPTPSLASLDQLGRVLYIGSFSKTISPSLRVGFLVCNMALAKPLAHIKMALGLTTSETSEQIVYAILTDGRHRSHLARLRERLARAQGKVCDGLANCGLTLFHRPAGGLFAWASLGDCDSEKAARLAAREDIMLAPGHLFSIDGGPSPWLRFNVAYSDDARLYRFLENLDRQAAQL
jgi:DNA-binding transcriptional MocR family regulator